MGAIASYKVGDSRLGVLLCALLLLLGDGGGVEAARWLRFSSPYTTSSGTGTGTTTVMMVEAEEEGGIAEVVHARRELQQAATYCVASPGASETALQTALDWACGQPNVDCSALQQGGACYNPDTVSAHASYAFDYYFVKQNGASDSCDFGGVATPTTSNPSNGTCVFPSVGSTGSSPSSSSNSSGLTPTANSTVFGSPPTTSSSGLTPTDNAAPLTLLSTPWIHTLIAAPPMLLLVALLN